MEICKGNSKAENATYVDGKKKERERIQKEIQELTKKGNLYCAAQQKDDEKGELETAPCFTAIQ